MHTKDETYYIFYGKNQLIVQFIKLIAEEFTSSDSYV